MEARELRYHNLVNYEINDTYMDRQPYYGKNIYQVEVIMDDSVKIGLGFEAIQRVLLDDPKLKPIPLSHGWFVKFGFEKDNAGFYKKGRFDYHEDYGWCILGNWVKSWVGVKMPTHVHQLQNLYFALTGEELKII